MNLKLKNKFGRKTIWMIFSEEDTLVGTLPESTLRLFLKQKAEFLKGDYFFFPDDQYENLEQSIRKHAWSKLCNYLTRQDHSEWECREYLRKIPASNKFIDELILLAKKHHFILDQRTAENYVLSMINRGVTAKECRYKLRLKKIEESIIDRCIALHYTTDMKEEIVRKHYEKASYKYRDLEPRKKREKVLNYLYRKGISYDDIMIFLAE